MSATWRGMHGRTAVGASLFLVGDWLGHFPREFMDHVSRRRGNTRLFSIFSHDMFVRINFLLQRL